MNFIHPGSKGDVIASLPTIRAMGGGSLYLRSEEDFRCLGRLLACQSYISKCEVLKSQVRIHHSHHDVIDLGLFARHYNRDKCRHLIQCHADIVGVDVDASAWLDVVPRPVAPVVINYTPRYHDRLGLNWLALEPFKENAVFIGLDDDYRYFLETHGIRVRRYWCRDALEMAQVIAGSRLFVGNQSLSWWLAEGLKVNRCLETCVEKNNSWPVGVGGYADDLQTAFGFMMY